MRWRCSIRRSRSRGLSPRSARTSASAASSSWRPFGVFRPLPRPSFQTPFSLPLPSSAIAFLPFGPRLSNRWPRPNPNATFDAAVRHVRTKHVPNPDHSRFRPRPFRRTGRRPDPRGRGLRRADPGTDGDLYARRRVPRDGASLRRPAGGMGVCRRRVFRGPLVPGWREHLLRLRGPRGAAVLAVHRSARRLSRDLRRRGRAGLDLCGAVHRGADDLHRTARGVLRRNLRRGAAPAAFAAPPGYLMADETSTGGQKSDPCSPPRGGFARGFGGVAPVATVTRPSANWTSRVAAVPTASARATRRSPSQTTA